MINEDRPRSGPARAALQQLSLALVLVLALAGMAGSAPQKDKPLAADLVEDGQLIDINSERYQELFRELQVEHGFSAAELRTLFQGVAILRRPLELMDRQWEAKPWYEYHPRFVTTRNINEGRKKLRRHKELLDRIEKDLGVEREIIIAIWGIESRYGKHKGAFSLFRTLNTMFDAYPRRRAFYRQQLVSFLLLCRENKIDPLGITGSYGGAFGQTQFIPSSFREYAVDYDKDNRRDVWSSVPDILASIANYLRRYKWEFQAPIYVDLGMDLKDDKLLAAYKKGRKGLVPWREVMDIQKVEMAAPPGDSDVTIVGLEQEDGSMRYVAGYPNFQAITKWNNSNRYAMAVTQLAERLRD